MVEQVLIETKANNQQAENEYVGLRKEIKALKGDLEKLDSSTDEYNQTFSKLSQKMFEQKERMEQLRQSSGDLGQLFKNTSSVAGVLSQSVAGLTSTFALFGIENENLVKTIAKIQQIESIAKTFEALEDAPKKIKAILYNIKGLLSQKNNALKVTVDTDVNIPGGNVGKQAVQTIDTEAFKDAAESSERMAQAQQGAAASMSSNAGTSKTLLKTELDRLNVEIEQNKLNIQSNVDKLTELENEKLITSEKIKQAQIDLNNFDLNVKKFEKYFDLNDKITTSNGDVVGSIGDSLNEKRKLGVDELESLNKLETENLENKKLVSDEINTQKNKLSELESTQQNLNKTTTGFGKIWGQMKGILTGVGIAAAITLIIAGFTYIIKQIQKANAEIKAFYENRAKFNEELSKSIESSGGKELAMLKTLQFGYNSLSGDKKKQQKFLDDNKDSYKKIGIEIDKLPNKEGALTKAIAKTNEVLIERARNMGKVNLLMTKYGEQFDLQTKKELAASDIRKFLPKEGALSVFEMENKGLMDYIAQVYAGGTKDSENIANMVIKKFPNLKPEFDDLVNTFDAVNKKYRDFITNTNTNAVELNNVNKQIGELEKGIKPFNLETDTKGADKGVTVIKTYTELQKDILSLYKNINLNDPYNPERIRQIEESFNLVKEKAEEATTAILKSDLSYEEKMAQVKLINMSVIKAEKEKINAERSINIEQARWTRDNALKSARDQQEIRNEYFTNFIKSAQASLAAGKINQKEFDDLFADLQKAAGTSFKTVGEFLKFINEKSGGFGDKNSKFITGIDNIAKGFSSVEDGVESFDLAGFKAKIKEMFGANIDVENPLSIDLGSLSTDEFNYLQILMDAYENYAKAKQDINIKSNADNRENTKKYYEEELNLIDIYTEESNRKYNAYYSKVRTEMNKRNTNHWITGFSGQRSGYQDAMDEIDIINKQADAEVFNQDQIRKSIEVKKNLMTMEGTAAADKLRYAKEIQDAEEALTTSMESESAKRKEAMDKEQAMRDELRNGIFQGLQDFTSAISDTYELAEQNELLTLKKRYKAQLITQDEYETESEKVNLKYQKQRQRLAIFQGTLSAISSGIGAFQSAMTSGIKPPWNYIIATASAAQAVGSVLAMVAQLKSLDVNSGSIANPSTSNVTSSLNYQLQEQQQSNDRMMNSFTSQRVYVSLTDIIEKNNDYNTIQSMSTF